jgi:hypothetical protein
MNNWLVPKMWEGGECWIIGGGPSMPREFGVPEDVIDEVMNERLPMSAYSPFLSPIHDKHVIGVNAAFFIGEWIDVIFFGDSGFYFENIHAMNAYPKVKICCNPNMVKKEDRIDGVKYVPRNRARPCGLSDSLVPSLSWNLNSGAAAINLAYYFGVKRVFLLGFDMKTTDEGAQHWHRHYAKSKVKTNVRNKTHMPFARHIKNFPMIRNDAKRLGLEIINVSPDSEITQFQRVTLHEALRMSSASKTKRKK